MRTSSPEHPPPRLLEERHTKQRTALNREITRLKSTRASELDICRNTTCSTTDRIHPARQNESSTSPE
jgi:hypothetical protein